MHTKATLAIGLCVAFLAILSVLHVLEPEFNPPHLISEYQLGRFGWLMSLAFFCLGAASFVLFAVARQAVRTRPGLFGTWGLLIIGVAISARVSSLLIQSGSSAACCTALVDSSLFSARPWCSRW